MAKDLQPRQLRATTQAIKDLIIEHGLRPGDPLPTEADLVELLEVSRSSLREAVRTLVALDILEVRHGTGTFVGQLSLRPLVEGMTFKGVLVPGDDFETMRQVVEVRVALDLSLAPRIVDSLSVGDCSDLRALCTEMTAASDRNEAFAAADRAFHLGLAERTGNELYGQLVAAFWDVHTLVAPHLGVPSSRDIKETAEAHAVILHMAERGDLEGYREAVKAHYQPLLRSLRSAGASAVAL